MEVLKVLVNWQLNSFQRLVVESTTKFSDRSISLRLPKHNRRQFSII